MKLIRYIDSQGNIQYGSHKGNNGTTRIIGDIFQDFEDSGDSADIVKLLTPFEPNDIICIGMNYRQHAFESKIAIPEHPIVFMKNSGSIQNPNDPIVIPGKLLSEKVDYECELAVVIGKTCFNVSKSKALEYVLGYTCANDVSARDWQNRDSAGQLSRSKTFATFCPFGPWIVTPDEIVDPNQLGIRTILNGQKMQDSNTSDMIFDVETIIEFLSGSTNLRAGTMILTGTPQGIGYSREPPVFMKDGDEVTIEIDKIGSLTNYLISENDYFILN
tara:strand:- start:423 stop:1244 length:822 start_codon:yes stop_codon:yes gene_type:complete